MTAIVLERCDSVDCAAFRDFIVVSFRSRTQEPANFPGKLQREERPRKCDEHKSWVLTAGDLLLRGDHAAPGSPLSFDVAGRKGEEPTKRTPRFRVTPPPSRRKGHLPQRGETSPAAAPRISLIVEPLKKKKQEREPGKEAGPFTSSTWRRRRRR